jgi:hypothetical protein
MFNPPDDLTTAIHEAGHSVAADLFRIPAYPEVTPGGFSAVTGTTDARHAGVCHFDDGPVSKFQLAVISWSGPLAHCLYGTRHDWMPPFKPSVKLLRDWHGMMLQQIARLSDGDRRGILGYRDSWRSCKSAFAIVRKNRVRIIRLAKAMTGATEKTAVPMPDNFPATLADFVRLVAGDDEQKFRSFVRADAEAFIAGLHLPPEQREQAIESWTVSRLEKFRLGFPDAAAWRATAKAFAASNKSKP